MAKHTLTYRGELRCFQCARYLGEFEAHPTLHGRSDVHFLAPEVGELPAHAVQSERGLSCSHCGGRVLAEHVDEVKLAA
jgi:DNA-directed RNA polymerase subunit RPC12/RpoP